MNPCPRPLAALLAALVVALPSGARADDADEEASPPQAAAPSESGPRYETVVTADPYGSGGTSVRQIRREDIEARGAANLAGLLELEASLNTSTGGRGERILTLRGFDQRQTAVLVDGAPVFVPYDGQLDLSQLPTAMVDRVTLARSPGVAAGPSGLGGAISVISRRPGSGPAVEARLEGSLPLQGRAELIHSGQSGALGYSVFGGGDYSEGFALASGFVPTANQDEGMRVGSDRSGYHLGATARFAPEGAHEASASALWVDSSRGIPPSTELRPARYWRFTTWRGLMLQASHRYASTAQTETTAYARLYDNLVDAYDDSSYSTQLSPSAFHSWYHDRAFGLRTRPRLDLDAPWGSTRLSLWAGAEYDRHRGDEEDAAAYERLLLLAAPEASARLARMLTATLACQIEAELPVDLPGEHSSPAVGVGPLASLHFELTDELSLGATAARRHRFPTLRERFSRGLGYRLPNPELRPEAAWHLDAEVAWRAASWLSLEVSLFDAEVEDLIEEVTLGGGRTRIENVGQARLAGAELSARVRPLPRLRIDASYALLHARRVDDERLEYRPAHKLTAGLIALPFSRVELSSFVRVVGPQSFRNPNTGAWGTLGTYAVWDAQIKVRAASFATVLARATNLLDASHQTKFGYPDPGRQLWLGIEADLPGEEG